MKKLISSILLLSMISNTALACDFKNDVEKLPDGRRVYSEACHVRVGEMKRDLEIKDVQIVEYKKAIELKDLALGTAQKRIDLWQDTSFKLEDRVNAMDSLRTKNYLLYFGLGVVVTGFAVWGASKMIQR